jgi:hypothetical protein
MKKIIACICISALSVGCENHSPDKLSKRFNGNGFLISSRETNAPVIFFPARHIDKEHFALSLNNDNLGSGITLGVNHLDLYNIKGGVPAVFLNINNKRHDIIYIMPVYLSCINVSNPTHCASCSINYKFARGEISKDYSYSRVHIDTLYALAQNP